MKFSTWAFILLLFASTSFFCLIVFEKSIISAELNSFHLNEINFENLDEKELTISFSASDYYVSSESGNDSFSGTVPDRPWKTLDKAKNAWDNGIIKAGDTIHLKKGSEFSGAGWDIYSGGSLTEGYVTITGGDYGEGTKPVFNVTNGYYGFHIFDGSHIVLKDFVIDGGNRGITAGILIGGGDIVGNISNIQIIDMNIKKVANSLGRYSNGIQITASKGYMVSNVLVQGNDISGYSAHGINHYADKQKGNLHTNIIYKNNYIHDPVIVRYPSAAAGIQISSGGSGNIFEYNVIDGPNPDGQIFIFDGADDENDIVIRYNILKNNSVGNGIWLHKHDNAVPNLSYGVSIYGNIISGNYMPGIYVGGGDNLLITARIYNNTFYNNDDQSSYSNTYDVGGELYLHGYNKYDVYVKNNIFYHKLDGSKNYDIGINDKFLSSNTFEHSNNLYWHSNGPNGIAIYDARTQVGYTVANINTFEPSAQNTDPLFIDFYYLTPTQDSNAINSGDDSIGVSYKIALGGVDRSNSAPWDIGAYEYVAGVPLSVCTESDWISTISPTLCPQTGQQIKTWTKVRNCENGITLPTTETVVCTYQAPICEKLSYSDWTPTICPQSGIQVRTLTAKTPLGCQGGNQELLLRNCTYIPICNESHWDYNLVPVICPNNGQQTKNYFKISNCFGGLTMADENISCVYNSPQCQYTYTNYGECIEGIKTRTATSASQPCQGYPIELKKTCPTTSICTESHWSFTLSECINGLQLKKWFKISDCEGGIQKVNENIFCVETENTFEYCGSDDWSLRVEPITCPSTGKQTKYWTRTNINCQAGLTRPAQEIITCTPESNSPENELIKCEENIECKYDEKCEKNNCEKINCEIGGIIENHQCVNYDIVIDLYSYTTIETVEEIENSGDHEALLLLNQARQSLSKGQQSKAVAEINIALLKTKIAEEPELQETYNNAMLALENQDYETANNLSIEAINKKDSASSKKLNTILTTLVILELLVLFLLLVFKRKRIKSSTDSVNEN